MENYLDCTGVICYYKDQTRNQKYINYTFTISKKFNNKDKKYMTYEEAQNILKNINKGINPHFSYCELIPKSIKKKNKKVKKSTPSKLKKVFSKKRNKKLHVIVTNELVQMKKYHGKGFNQKAVKRWEECFSTKSLKVNLKPYFTKYGASGCKQLLSLFKLS